jgi:Ca2+-binding RTX toxin-like protein
VSTLTSADASAASNPPFVDWEGNYPNAVIWSAGAGAVAPYSKVLITDSDSPSLASATISFQRGYHPGEDVLSFTGSAGTGDISGVFDAATGAMTLTSASGHATVAQWQAAVRAVAYADSSPDLHVVDRLLHLTVSDGTATGGLLLTVQVAGGTGADHLIDEAGVSVNAGGGDDLITLANVPDTLGVGRTLDGGAGFNTVDASAFAYGATFILGAGAQLRANVPINSSTTYFYLLSNIQGAIGTSHDDTFTAAVGGSTMQGGAGEDTFNVSGGTNRIDGGADFDAVSYNTSPAGVTVDLRISGPQTVSAGHIDTLISIERVYGSLHDDTLTGDAGPNGFIGGGGRDVIDGGGGNNWLGFYGYTTGVTVSLANSGWQDLGPGGAVRFSNIQALFGSDWADTLTGDAGDNYLAGGPNADTLDGAGGFNTADYDDGYAYGAGVHVDLSISGTQNTGVAGVDTLVNIQGLLGTPWDDVLLGNAGDNVISGWSGNDVISGGAGNDLLRHNDPVNEGTVVYGNDTFTGGAGNDTIEGGSGHDVAVYSGARSDYTVTLGAQGWTVADHRAGSPDGRDVVSAVETLRFADGDITQAATAGVAAAVTTLLREDPFSTKMDDVSIDLAHRLSAGSASLGDVVAELVVDARPTSSVATLAYQFFTGSTPSAAGMDYLVSSTGPNPNNLNSAYYQSFSMENRYINFAVNLGKVGAGQAQFQAQYGSLNLFDATKKAYEAIFGGAPTDAKVHDLLDPSITLNGHTFTRADYFADYGGDGANGIGTKAAMVGWLLTEAVKADLGVYAKSNDAFLTDLATHDAPFAVDMVGHYAQPAFVFHPA